ncbi:MAG: GAF domain-containing protein, partial [Chloroflexota bacterium]|nr:GAF domain-containing protein [Chloroflexota bacterium]
LELDTLLHSIVTRAVELLGGTAGGLYLYRPDLDALEWSVASGAQIAPVGTVLRQGEGLSGRILETGEPLIVDDYQQWQGRATAWEDYPGAAVVGAPILMGEEFLGVLNVRADAPNAFSPADAELLSLLATQAAIAIRNVRLYDAERKRRAELESLRQASLRLTSTLELQPVLETILDHTLRLVAADDAHIFLYDGERLTFGTATWAGDRQQEPYSEPRPQGLTHAVASSGERIVIPNVDEHPLFKGYPWGGAIAGLPLRVGERVVGVMNIAFEKPHTFTEDELRALGLLATQAAIAIENARLFEAAQRELAERKQAEEEIKRVAKFPGENPNPVLRVAENGTLLYANEASRPLLRAWGCQVHQALPDYWREFTLNVLSSGVKEETEVEYDDLTFSFTFAPMVDAGYVNLYGLDITERKLLEEQLRQAQKMEAVGRLAGGVAHDFNNLLTAIIGYSDLLQRGLNPYDPRRNDVLEIKKAADRAAGLVRQLLAFSRKQMLQPKVLDLNATIVNMKKMLHRLIREDIELLTILDPDLGSVKADPGQIEQVIVNLVINASDAMPQGGKLTVETMNVYLDEEYDHPTVSVQPGPYAMIVVSDTGVGMDEDTQSHLFEPFFTTKEMGKGTGLGLATIYGIIKQSDGHIEVSSDLGQGTTFKVYLPAISEAVETAKQAAISDGPALGQETILLVEDEETVRDLARRVLLQRGYTVLEARHGKEALRICEEHEGPIDLLMTDVVMPEMNGRDLAEHLAPLYPEMKVLYVSGYTDNAIVHHGILESGVNLLPKPFTPSILARRVREVLDASISPRAPDKESAR